MRPEEERGTTHEPLLEDRIGVDAPVSRVWELVGDVCRMPEWSPQVMSTRLRAGHDRCRLGVESTSRNHEGELEWNTHGQITRYDPEQAIAFRIAENWVVWSFLLAPTDDGMVVLRRHRVSIRPRARALGLLDDQQQRERPVVE